MALVDRLKWDAASDDELVWKWPSDNLRLGTQLIVHDGQEALFFKGGRALDLFGSGTHTLSTRNLPVLGGLVNLPYGGATPFAAEVWFVSKTAKLDLKWGTTGAMQVLDPRYSIPVSLRAFGQYGVRVADSRSFVHQLVGARGYASTDQILSYFTTEIIQRLSSAMAGFLAERGISVFELAANLDTLSEFVKDRLKLGFERFGIELVTFGIARASIPEEEMNRFQAGFERRMEIENIGRTDLSDTYTRMRQLDALANLGASEVGAVFLGNAALGGALDGVGGPLQPERRQPASPEPAGLNDPAERLIRLKALRDQGLITDEEYQSRRNAILAEL